MSIENLYTDIEKATLQFIVSYGSVRDEYLETTHTKFKSDFEDSNYPEDVIENLRERSLEKTIELINTRLQILHFQIVKVRSQGLQEVHYAYINTLSDSASKIFSIHTPKEIDIIKKMIDAIFTDNEDTEKYLVGAKEALRFCSDEGLTGSSGQQFLNKLVHEGFFNFSRSGKYTLGLRALTELKRSLLDKYGARSLDNDDGYINICIGCKEIVTLGVRCANVTCNARLHKGCQEHYSRAKGSHCPNPECDNDWSTHKPLYVGEGALKQRIID